MSTTLPTPKDFTPFVRHQAEQMTRRQRMARALTAQTEAADLLREAVTGTLGPERASEYLAVHPDLAACCLAVELENAT